MLVDTSAWIEWLRGTGSKPDLTLRGAFDQGTSLWVSGVIVQEMLQGSRTERQAAELSRLLATFESIEPVYPDTYEHAASIYRRCRRAGRTVRTTIDCLVGALALEHDLPVLAHDRDFDALARVCGLRLVTS
jgi:predicted nucleic acid-binding protein